MKLTKAMKEQLLDYIKDVKCSGVFWGDRQDFWKRHDKIQQWVEGQEVTWK